MKRDVRFTDLVTWVAALTGEDAALLFERGPSQLLETLRYRSAS